MIAKLNGDIEAANQLCTEEQTALAQAESDKVTLAATLNEHAALIAGRDAEIEALKANEVTAEARAQAIVAATGVPALVIANSEAQSKTHREIFDSLSGGEATAYYRANREAIIAG